MHSLAFSVLLLLPSLIHGGLSPAPAATLPPLPGITPSPGLDIAARNNEASGEGVLATATPTSTPPEFIGWLVTNDFAGMTSSDELHCPMGETYTASGDYARYCPTGVGCNFFTACTRSELFDDRKSISTCIHGYKSGVCIATTIFAVSPSAHPKTMYGCGLSDRSEVLYREEPGLTSDSGTRHRKPSRAGIIAVVVVGTIAFVVLMA